MLNHPMALVALWCFPVVAFLLLPLLLMVGQVITTSVAALLGTYPGQAERQPEQGRAVQFGSR